MNPQSRRFKWITKIRSDKLALNMRKESFKKPDIELRRLLASLKSLKLFSWRCLTPLSSMIMREDLSLNQRKSTDFQPHSGQEVMSVRNSVNRFTNFKLRSSRCLDSRSLSRSTIHSSKKMTGLPKTWNRRTRKTSTSEPVSLSSKSLSTITQRLSITRTRLLSWLQRSRDFIKVSRAEPMN